MSIGNDDKVISAFKVDRNIPAGNMIVLKQATDGKYSVYNIAPPVKVPQMTEQYLIGASKTEGDKDAAPCTIAETPETVIGGWHITPNEAGIMPNFVTLCRQGSVYQAHFVYDVLDKEECKQQRNGDAAE